MEYKDYYQILGVPRDADEKVIKKTYRKLARENHPDTNPNDKDAERRFKEIGEAYAVLSDPEKRAKYDRFGSQWEQYARAGGQPQDFDWNAWSGGGRGQNTRTVSPEEFEQMFGGSGMGGFSDFFDALFGGGMGGARRARTSGFEFNPQPARPPRQQPTVPTTISLEEAFQGTTRTLQREDGQRLEVKIPRGVKTGSRVRVSGSGGGGDLYLQVEVAPHAKFTREGDNLRVPVPVDLYTVVLGGEVQVPTLERPVVLTVPEGTQNGKTFRLSGLGMPKLRNPEQRGDLYAVLEVQMPRHLGDEERRLFQRLRELSQVGVH